MPSPCTRGWGSRLAKDFAWRESSEIECMARFDKNNELQLKFIE